MLDPSGIAITTAPDYQFDSAVSFGGGYYYVVWKDDNAPGGNEWTYGTRVSTGGTPSNLGGIVVTPTANFQADQAVAFGGGFHFVAWRDGFDIFGGRVTSGGTSVDPKGLLASTAPTSQFQPDVAFDGTNYLVVWADNRAGNSDIYGTRVTPAGTVLDPAGIPISTASGDQFSTHVAFDGTNFYVVWADRRTGALDIYGTRLSKAGALLDGTGVAVSAAAGDQFLPDVTFDGTRFLVAWVDQRLHAPNSDVFAARVNTTDGSVADASGLPVSTGGGGTAADYATLSVAHASGNSLIAWTDFRSGSDDIFGARISSAGVVANPGGTLISTNTAGSDQDDPAVAANGADYFVVWDDNRNATTDIYGTRLTGNGGVGDPNGIAISTAPGLQYTPTIAKLNDYLVAWVDGRNPVTLIYGTRIGTDGAVKDPDGLQLAPQFVNESSPALTTNWALTYSRDHSGGSGIFYRPISPK